jgi:ParB family transcriptional regulator, chromosome partitioning protein
MSQFYNDSIFWVEVGKIRPNPYQPRREFDEMALKALADSIKQYGILQALVVTKIEVPKEDGGIAVEYELIAGERRLRASRLAGLKQVPVLIRAGEENDLMKLELAIIENVQREDLNAVERAKAFKKLVDEFGFKHGVIGQKIGKSREYVSNTLRILALPEDMVNALSEGKITEGHTRPLLMLTDRPEEQLTLFKEIIYKKINVREAENIARKIAIERARKITPEMDAQVFELEEKFSESLGTRVQIEKRREGGKLVIDFFSYDDLRNILQLMKQEKRDPNEMLEKRIKEVNSREIGVIETKDEIDTGPAVGTPEEVKAEDDRTQEEIKVQENTDIDDELYSIKNFSI